MNISIVGKLIDCVTNTSKDGSKNYYSLNVYNEGTTYRVGVPYEIFKEYENRVDEFIELKNISLWVDGKSSFYIKG